MFVTQCPNCRSKLKSDKTYPAGKTVTCPNCSTPFVVGADSPVAPAAAPVVVARPVSRPAVARAIPVAPGRRPVLSPAAAPPVPDPPAPAAEKIAFTPVKGRPPVNWAMAAACIFVAGSVFTILTSPVYLLEGQGPNVSLFALVSAALCGALFAGFFASALCPRDGLWQPGYAGVAVGLIEGLWALGYTLRAAGGEWSGGALLLLTAGTLAGTLAVAGPAVFAGGLLERSLMTAGRRLRPPRRWVYETRDGRSVTATAPARYPVQAAFWSVARWLFLVSWVPTCFVETKDAVKNVVPSAVMYAVCGRMARKRRVRSAEEALAKDDRPPIVYLRSFRDDGRASGESGWSNWGGGRMGALLSPPFEDVLARVMNRYGPFVAIGRPGEEVADVGAARMYVGDDDWQAVVSDLLAEPGAMAFLQAGETAGLNWELRTAGEALRPDQLLIFLPFAFEPSDRAREKQYAAFREWASRCLPDATLPETFPAKARYLYFHRRPAWAVEALGKASEVPDRHALADVLTDLQANWGMIRRKRQTPRWLLAALLGIATVILVGVTILVIVQAVRGGGQAKPAPPAAGAGGAAAASGPTEYVGKAMPYRIRLDAAWKEVPNPDNADREFDVPDGPNLIVQVFGQSGDVGATVDGVVTKFGPRAVVLERKTVRRRGHDWLECRLKVTTDGKAGWLTYRVWSKGDRTVVLISGADVNDERTARQAVDALDAFELPPDVPPDP